jgi:uncharacterized RDD family membrane protein YckC
VSAAELEYVGFWLRVWATVIDTLCVLLLLSPLAALVGSSSTLTMDQMLADPSRLTGATLLSELLPSGSDLVIWVLLPALLVLVFWDRKLATPGKMAIRAKIVDATTGAAPTRRQWAIRYLGYFVSTLPFGLGLAWVGFDPRKQGWHDKLAGTVVVRPKKAATTPVAFERPSRGKALV